MFDDFVFIYRHPNGDTTQLPAPSQWKAITLAARILPIIALGVKYILRM